MILSFAGKTKRFSVIFALFSLIALFFASCSNISSSPTGSVSFSVSGEAVSRILAESQISASARYSDPGVRSVSFAENSENSTVYLQISLKGGSSQSKTVALSDESDAVVSFDGISTGAKVYAEALVYSVEKDGESSTRTELYSGTSETVTIHNGENAVSLLLSKIDLVRKAYSALNSGDYDAAVSNFRLAYEKNPSDANKIYYALTELATISTDETIVDIIRNDLGITDYPATLNAIFNPSWTEAINSSDSSGDSVLNTGWLKKYPRYESLKATKFEKSDSGDYVRVSGTPVAVDYSGYNGYNDYGSQYEAEKNSVYIQYVLHTDDENKDGVWVSNWEYSAISGENYHSLSDWKIDDNGKYLVLYNSLFNYSEYRQKAVGGLSDCIYTIKINYDSSSDIEITQVEDADLTDENSADLSSYYIRVEGTEVESEKNYYNDDSVYTQYKFEKGAWSSSYIYIKDYKPSADGDYLVPASDFIYRYAQSLAKESFAGQLYSNSENYDASVLGEILMLPGLKIPDWVKSNEYFTESLIGTTQTYETWLYLLYANIVTSHENGFNDTLDKLLSVIDEKTKTVSELVDSLGSGTAYLDATLIKNLNLTEILGEEPVDFGKTEMSVLASALEALDSVLNFAASYDLSADLSSARVGLNLSRDEAVEVLNKCITAQTLAQRDESDSKLATSKNLLLSAISRLLSAYNEIQKSETYPQAAKDKIKEYGDFIKDGAEKAKAAIEKGGIFYLPQISTTTQDDTATSVSASTELTSFPASAEEASFGIDFGKIFEPGYFTNIIERDETGENLKIYYTRYERTYSSGTSSGSEQTEREKTEPAELTGTIEKLVEDAGYTSEYKTDETGAYIGYSSRDIRYEIGIMANKSLIIEAFPGISDDESADAENGNSSYFIPLFFVGD